MGVIAYWRYGKSLIRGFLVATGTLQNDIPSLLSYAACLGNDTRLFLIFLTCKMRMLRSDMVRVLSQCSEKGIAVFLLTAHLFNSLQWGIVMFSKGKHFILKGGPWGEGNKLTCRPSMIFAVSLIKVTWVANSVGKGTLSDLWICLISGPGYESPRDAISVSHHPLSDGLFLNAAALELSRLLWPTSVNSLIL